MRLTKGVSLFAALGVCLATMMIVVSPLLDLECGRDPGHLAGNLGEESRFYNGTAPATQSNPCDHQPATSQQAGSSQQEGEAVHVHGMNANALLGISPTALLLETPMLLPPSSESHLSGATVPPFAKPPRISA